MKVLVACEESQAVCKAFRAKGHEAYSCDIIPCSGGHPEWHIQGDVLDVLNPRICVMAYVCAGESMTGIEFYTCDNKLHAFSGGWDLIIAHPPCTYLTVTGNRWFNVERYGNKARRRLQDREDAAEFFMAIAGADCDKIAIENPVGYMNTHWRKPDQIIQPYMFGDPARKKTCLWLKNLPMLEPENIVDPNINTYICKDGKKVSFSADYCWQEGGRRSKTYPGIANAMSNQWG